MSALDRLLVAALKAGGQEVRLEPGRRVVVRTPSGEREAQGAEQTSEGIERLITPTLPSGGRDALRRGRLEWTFDSSNGSAFRGVAERRTNGVHASFTLSVGTEAPAHESEPPPAAPARKARGHAAPAAAPTPSAAGAEVDALFRALVEMRASDLHLSVGSPPMVRHDGVMRPLPGKHAVLTPEEVRRLLWPIAPERNREEFERRHDTDFAYEIAGLARFRCNLFLDRKGMGGVFRVIPSRIMTAEDMALSREILQLCSLPKGLVLVTGPTGSGKSTTLCALIDYINRTRSDHIITIEDPLEFVHENKKCLINQRQVGQHTDSFKDALRAALREDPDIVLVGEMRDLETMAIAIETAETGHLVFGTLHTSSAASTVDRIIDQFPADRQAQIRIMLSESLKAVISQILCRKAGGGRVPALEVMIGIPSVSNLIREGKTFQIPSIMQTAKKHGMVLMNDSLGELVRKGLVEPQEAFAKAADKSGLINQLKRLNIDTSWAQVEAAPPA
jgi:twitching motility protein PilT